MNKDEILDIFYSTKGGLDKINAAIEKKLQKDRKRKQKDRNVLQRECMREERRDDGKSYARSYQFLF